VACCCRAMRVRRMLVLLCCCDMAIVWHIKALQLRSIRYATYLWMLKNGRVVSRKRDGEAGVENS
jgi:hypothetical protein